MKHLVRARHYLFAARKWRVPFDIDAEIVGKPIILLHDKHMVKAKSITRGQRGFPVGE